MACSRYKCGMDGLRHCAPGSGWLTIVAASIALSPLLAGCSSLSSSSASSPAPEPGVASASPSSSPAAPSSSSASGTSAGTVKQSFVGFLKVFRDPEPDEVDAPAKIGAAQPQPGAPFSSSASSSAPEPGAGGPLPSPSGSPAAPSSSSASGTSAKSLKQSLVYYLKAFRDLEPDEVGAPARIGAAQPQPTAASNSSRSRSQLLEPPGFSAAKTDCGAVTFKNARILSFKAVHIHSRQRSRPRGAGSLACGPPTASRTPCGSWSVNGSMSRTPCSCGRSAFEARSSAS